jgi:tRNA-dihydrouridine synthase B
VQIAGADPALMADAARYNVERGAQIIDINMGCPAKKVCNAAAGSALLADEPLVARILAAVVAAVPVPVTLKIRTGPAPHARNALAIARIAQDAGIAALAVHGRTRACLFVGDVEYATIAAVKAAVDIPVLANGNVDTPEQAAHVLAVTGADGLMIGRAAQGRPWIFREIGHYLTTGKRLAPPTVAEMRALIVEHLADHYAFYGDVLGVRIARKHLGWYTETLAGGADFRRTMNAAETVPQQLDAVERYFDTLARAGAQVPPAAPLRRAGHAHSNPSRTVEALAA